MSTPGTAVPAQCEDIAWFRDRADGARGAVAALARRVGLGEPRTAETVLAVSELVTNMRKHAVEGSLLLRVLRTPTTAGVEVVVIDRGPGIADVEAAMRDGMSTVGTLGVGLGAVRRLADTFDIHSRPGVGTVQLARFWPRGTPPAATHESVVGGITRPMSGEETCGDAWAARIDVAERAPTTTHATTPPPEPPRPFPDWAALTGAARPAPGPPVADHPLLHRVSGIRAEQTATALPGPGAGLMVMMCDGLGHGPSAALAGQAAAHAFLTGTARTPERAMEHIHAALRGTRGAAVAIARIEPANKRLLFCGVGNITAALVTDTTRANLLSQPGIAGHRTHRLRTYELPLPDGGALVMHSDGLSERWTPTDLTGLLHHRPAVIAAGLLRHAGTRRDDAGVVITKDAW